MKIFKFAAVSAVLVLMVGCTGLSESQRKLAQSAIASDLYLKHVKAKYTVFTKQVMVDDVSGDSILIEPVPYTIDLSIVEKCEGLLSFNDDDVEKLGFRMAEYELKSTAKVDSTAFNQCVDNYLVTHELDAKNLDLLINNSDFKTMKQQPSFAKKGEEIKQDEMVSLHETLEILSIMRNHEKNIAKADYQSKIKAL